MVMPFIFACNLSQDKSNTTSADQIKESTLPPQTAQQEDVQEKKFKREYPDTSGNSFQTTSTDGTNDWDKKIIKTGSLTLQVKDFKKFSEKFSDAVKQYGGYIANEVQNQSEEKLESSVSIKVPVDKFDDLMNQLPESGDKLIEKKISTDNVTGEIIDVRSRLQAKEQMRLKYLEFLKQSKNMEDVLKVQAEINDIQEAIESASGRINYLKHQSAYSTINLIYFQPKPGYQPINNNPGLFTRGIAAFKSGFNFFAEILIGIISIWPLILLAIIGIVFFKKITWKGTIAKQKI
jgi:hypothetical protein